MGQPERAHKPADITELPIESSLAVESLAQVISLPAKRRESISHHENPQNEGFMIFRNSEQADLPIERTFENSHFFVQNNIGDGEPRFELVYHHSALIVAQLDLHLESKRVNALEFAHRLPYFGRLAFFDKQGTFYNLAELQELRPEQHSSGKMHEKHTAIFTIPENDTTQQIEMPVDNIYCLSMAPFPFVWEGDNT